ncbi:MAG: polysaccharide deacetylase family protein [Candidatus Parcubacteria bacterium]|nr:polysaccharide deacetylase family protein [Candidatus Parcubacteria bacterium]
MKIGISKKFLKNLIFLVLNVFSAVLPKRRAVILLYHGVDYNDVFLTVRIEVFEKQMRYLKAKKCNVISLERLVAILATNKKIPKKTVVLTFDDGLESHYKNVLPILNKYDFSATFFISAGLVGSWMNNQENLPQKTADWNELASMLKSPPIDIEPHGISHQELDKLEEKEIIKEIDESTNAIKNKLERNCYFFAYPRGKYNSRVIDILKGRGFKAAVTINEGVVKAGDDLFLLKRNTIDSSCDNSIQFKARLGWPIVLFNLLLGI